MKGIISFLIILLAVSLFMAMSRDYEAYRQLKIGIAPKVEPPAPPVEYRSPELPERRTQRPELPEPPAEPSWQPEPPASNIHETPSYDPPVIHEEDEYIESDNYNETYPLTTNAVVQEIQVAFGPEWKTALAIAKAESSLNPHAVNRNRNGSRDIGIFQINDKHGWSDEERFDWRKNIWMAKELRDRCGWSEWSVYNNGRYRQFL